MYSWADLATSIKPKPQGLPEVDHKNANRQDNSAANLRWCDRRDNVNSALSMGHWRRPLKIKATNMQTAGVRYYAFLKHASQDIFGNNYSLNFSRKRYGDSFEKAGWRFEVIEDGI